MRAGRGWAAGRQGGAALRGCAGPRAPAPPQCACAVPLFQRRSLAPSQLAKRKAGDEEEEEEEEDRHLPTVSKGPRDVAASAGKERPRPWASRPALAGVGGVGPVGRPEPLRPWAGGCGAGWRRTRRCPSRSLVPGQRSLPPPSSGD